jgi:hypothetical protein
MTGGKNSGIIGLRSWQQHDYYNGVDLHPDSLKTRILKHESICSIEDYYRSHPSEAVLKELKEAIAEIAGIAHNSSGKQCR